MAENMDRAGHTDQTDFTGRDLLLLGATGLVGRQVLTRALVDARVGAVVAPTRRPLPAHPKLSNPIVDYTALPDDAPWWRADAAICTLGTTLRDAGSREAFRQVDFDHVLAAARLARRHGVDRFAYNSSLGADAASGNFYLQVKGEVETALADCGFGSLTIVRPSLIGGERERRRPLEHLGMVLLRALAPLVPRRYRVAEAGDIATALLEGALTAAPGRHVIESEALQPRR